MSTIKEQSNTQAKVISFEKGADGTGRWTHRYEPQPPPAPKPALYKEARNNPWRLFSVVELAEIFCVSPNVIFHCKKNGAHFTYDKARPEAIADFLSRSDCRSIQLKSVLPKIGLNGSAPRTVPDETVGKLAKIVEVAKARIIGSGRA